MTSGSDPVVTYSGGVAAWKPAYLIHGDAHGRISERRGRLRALAEQQSGVEAVEVFEGEAATPEAVAGALNAMTFAVGRRFVIVEGVERWKDAEVSEHLDASRPALTLGQLAQVVAPLADPAVVVAVDQVGGLEGRHAQPLYGGPRSVTVPSRSVR
jgi:DNA polymerase-3 subunit delta